MVMGIAVVTKYLAHVWDIAQPARDGKHGEAVNRWIYEGKTPLGLFKMTIPSRWGESYRKGGRALVRPPWRVQSYSIVISTVTDAMIDL